MVQFEFTKIAHEISWLSCSTWHLQAQGSSIYDVQKAGFLTPSCPHASTWALWPSTSHRHEIHITLLKRLVQWPSEPKAEVRLWYHCNLFKTILLVSYINNFYWRKVSTFYSSPKTKFFAEKTQKSLLEKKTGWRQWALIFCVDVHMTLTPSTDVSTWAWPLPCGSHKWMAPCWRDAKATITLTFPLWSLKSYKYFSNKISAFVCFFRIESDWGRNELGCDYAQECKTLRIGGGADKIWSKRWRKT